MSRNMDKLSRKDEYAAATRQALMDAALEQFNKKGFNKTSIEDIVKAARVTRGALYHHFNGKEEIFIQVYKELLEELVAVIRKSIKGKDDPWEKAIAGCRSYLDYCIDPNFKSVCLHDAIGVLGWKKWREISSDYTTGLLKDLLEGIATSGSIAGNSIDHAVNLLYSILVEAVLTIANSQDKVKAHDEVSQIVQKMLLGLRG